MTMFGKRKKSEVDVDSFDSDDELSAVGPYDVTEVDEESLATDDRLDLGSVVVPIPSGAQLQIEMAPDATPQAVHLMTDHGRITVAAYAAPKSAGQWREVTTDLSDSLRNDNAQVSIENGPWGREVVASTPGADLRFIGVDGYRWMVRLVAAGAAGTTADGQPLVDVARAVLEGTVVRRGDDPHPVRTPLPVVLPQVLADQLIAAQQQQLAQQQVQAQQGQPQPVQPQQGQPPVAPQQQVQPEAQVAAPEPPAQPQKKPRRGAGGSAMQQMGR